MQEREPRPGWKDGHRELPLPCQQERPGEDTWRCDDVFLYAIPFALAHYAALIGLAALSYAVGAKLTTRYQYQIRTNQPW